MSTTKCACGNPITHAHGALGCIQCGQPCCHACGASLESVMYCDRCAGALLGLEVIGHIGLARNEPNGRKLIAGPELENTRVAGCQLGRRQFAVPGALRGQIAPHQRDAGHRKDPEAPAGCRREGLPQGEARFPTPGALVEDPADREMGMPGLALAGNTAALERGLDAGLNLAGRERPVRDAHPQDARPLEAGEGAETVQGEREGGRDRRRLDQRRLDPAELLIAIALRET